MEDVRIATNGRVFEFSLWASTLFVEIDGRPHMFIDNVHRTTFTQEVDRFMDNWNLANFPVFHTDVWETSYSMKVC